MERSYNSQQQNLSKLNYKESFLLMNFPIGRGKVEANYFIERAITILSSEEIYDILTKDYSKQSIFRKEQTFIALCNLYEIINEEISKQKILCFLNKYRNRELNILNQVECTYLRITRKALIIYAYPKVRQGIEKLLEKAPEFEKFILKPSALSKTYMRELVFHNETFKKLITLDDTELIKFRDFLELFESKIESDFKIAFKNLPTDEHQIGGFEFYGHNRRHYSFNNIMRNYKLID